MFLFLIALGHIRQARVEDDRDSRARVRQPGLEEVVRGNVNHEMIRIIKLIPQARLRFGSSVTARDTTEHLRMQPRHIWQLAQRGQLGDGGIDAFERSIKGLLHDLECEGGGAEAHLLVDVLEHEGVLAGNVSPTRAPEADVVPHHVLELECDMLDDVWRIGASAQPSDEAAALADGAAMLDEARHRGNETIRHALHIR
ncbi:MAG: hypothetical protein JWM95_4777 [Gemmatimonadetes bacterium]|nr:hypothetical protein [Gemmatimonadota bacterium]